MQGIKSWPTDDVFWPLERYLKTTQYENKISKLAIFIAYEAKPNRLPQANQYQILALL